MGAIAVFTQRFDDPYLSMTFDPADYAAVLEHRSVATTTRTLRQHNVSAVVAAYQTSMVTADLIAQHLGVLIRPLRPMPGATKRR